MGEQNKLLLPFDGKTVIERVVQHVGKSEAGEVLVVLGHEAEKVREKLQGESLICVENPRYAEGMTSSIQAGVLHADPETQGFLICLSDQPLLETEEINLIIEAFLEMLPQDPEAIILPRFEGQPGNPVLFSHTYRARILAHQEPNGCKAIVQAHKPHIHFVEMPTSHVLQDMDDPEAYAALLKGQGD